MIQVKWVDGYYDHPEHVPKRKIGNIDILPQAVLPLAALTDVVEGLKSLDSHCDRIAVLSKCSGSAAEARMALVVIQRLLTQLEAHRKEGV